MDAESVLCVIVGLFIGYITGHFQTWYFARKLEHHKVSLKQWDAPIDVGNFSNGPGHPAE